VGSVSTVLCGCEVAEDGGVGSVAAYARLSVQVVDVNDNSPELLVNALTESGRVEVAENAPANTFTAYVAVRDADAAQNAVAECRIDSTSTAAAAAGIMHHQTPLY